MWEWIESHHALTAGACALVVLSILVLWGASLRLPDLNSFDDRIVRQSTKIYDRTGEILLFDVHENIRRSIVGIEDVSIHIQNAAVAVEDESFYTHNGVDIMAIFRAVFRNTLSGNPLGGQGGSTITQQVVKNALLNPEKRISRKIKEWVLAFRLEQVLSKEEILEIYLNEAPYGGSIYGVREATRSFFGKEPADVTIAEAAYLAALPQAPTYYSPYGSHVDDLERRKNFVLQKMHDNEFITDEEYESALVEDVDFLDRQDINIRAPHFVFYVIEYLEQKYGAKALSEDGLRVITTLDWELQQEAERIVKEYALQNEENFNAENAALVAVDPQTGHILTMVGSRDYFDENIDGKFNIATAERQPGSSFKPFVYAAALEKGYTPETILFDLQTEFSARCTPTSQPISAGAECYSPQNYDFVFRGPMSMRDALAQSVNIPAVKMLYMVGLNAALDFAKRMGISTLAGPDQYGLTLVLGGGEVTPLEMASAYGVFANEGKRNEHTGILSVTDTLNRELEAYKQNEEEVIPADVAHQMSDILSDNDARAPAFGSNSGLFFPGYDVAAKTGTTNDYRDAWIVGYTPAISVSAWAGNNDNTSMEKRVAGFIVAPLWNEFMQVALQSENYRHTPFPVPSPEPLPPDAPNVLRGIWLGNIGVGTSTSQTTSIHSILHWINKENPRGPSPSNPSSDPQYDLWEYSVRAWATAQGVSDIDLDDVLVDGGDGEVPRVSVSGLQTNYTSSDTLQLRFVTEGDEDVVALDVYINNRFITSLTDSPFRLTRDLASIPTLGALNTLRVVARDSGGDQGELTASFAYTD